MLLLLLMKKITPIDPLKMKKFYKKQADRPLLWDEQTNKEASNSRIEDLVQREETVWSSCRSSCDVSNQWIPRNANNSNNTSAQLPIQNNATKRDAIHRHAIWKRRRLTDPTPPPPQPTSLPSVFQQPSIPAADAAI